MNSIFRLGVSTATLLQLVADLSWLFVAGVIAIRFNEQLTIPFQSVFAPALVFAVVIVLLNIAFGMYRRADKLTSSTYLVRMLIVPAIGVPLAYLIVSVLPTGRLLQNNLGMAMLVAIGGLLLIRHLLVLPLVANLAPHRVLVLGTGPEARLVEASLSAANLPGMNLVGFYALDKVHDMAVSPQRVIARGGTLEGIVRQLRINEIIVAVRQQRGGVLPLRSLLDCRLDGVRVTDLSRFFERVHGQVPIESLKVSWLIYGNGYRQNWRRTFMKRVFDIVVAAILLVLSLPIMLMATLLILFEDGGPVVYRQQRVGARGATFTLLKFRSMRKNAEKDGKASWATVNDSRVTQVGKFLRRTRIDELPQLLNVLRGEMSFVGPRPERPEFVAMLTEQIPFYAVRHSVKPGLTGWAQVRYSYGATVEQSVKKLEYDLYYVKNHTLVLDLVILLETVRVVLLGEGAR
ncbi:MAG TPA: TIGR03013 family XrtA/PEP-CTERM system glycosyltransferase [Casimicrobiaceae bacterium]|nr:TIGR03013 family XrtA/PEP-CTERM system glycosyltransferase [Casimicrobiaceae bacterium]